MIKPTGSRKHLMDRSTRPRFYSARVGSRPGFLAWVLCLRSRAAGIALLSLVGLDVAWRWTNLYSMFVGHERQVASSRYETILMVPFVLGVALFFQATLNARPWVKRTVFVLFVVLTGVTSWRPYETLLRPFTIDYEYQFLRRHALTLPSPARLYSVDPPIDDIGFVDAHLVGRFAGSAVSFGKWSERDCDELQRETSPVYLYIGSSCAALNDARNHPLPSPDYARWLQYSASMRARLAPGAVEQADAQPARWLTMSSRTQPSRWGCIGLTMRRFAGSAKTIQGRRRPRSRRSGLRARLSDLENSRRGIAARGQLFRPPATAVPLRSRLILETLRRIAALSPCSACRVFPNRLIVRDCDLNSTQSYR